MSIPSLDFVEDGARAANCSSFSSPTLTCKASSSPSRMIFMMTSFPTLVLPTIWGRSEEDLTFLPSNSTITSPCFIPAFSAGDAPITSDTSAPFACFKSNVLASSGVICWIDTPSHPRVTLPRSLSCGSTSLAMSMGIAKPMPMEPPVGLKMAVLIPTASPLMLSRGPPLLPRLIEASVWMKLSYGPSPMKRPLALTIPEVTVWFKPNGLPIAMTGSPTSSFSESPNGITGRFDASILMSAMSVFGSLPITFALNSLASLSLTEISVAFSTTWLLVRIYPSLLMMNPDPRLVDLNCRGVSPKNRLKNSLNGSSSPKGLRGRPLPFTTCVVLTFTTEGVSSFANRTQILPSEIWLALNRPLSRFSLHSWPLVAFESGTRFNEAVTRIPTMRQEAATASMVLPENFPIRISSLTNGSELGVVT